MARGTKVLNQKIYSPVLYGGETSGDDVIIDASSSSVKGPVRVIGSMLEITINGQTGQILHTNSLPRIYALPDNSGTLFCSGYFTAANQLVYAASVGVFGILDPISSAVLTTGVSGTLAWASGVNGQVMTLVGGVPSFAALPDNGVIATGNGNTLPVYQSPGPGKNLVSLPTVTARALLSTSSGIAWALIPSTYLLGSGGSALTTGGSGQILSSLGDGSFGWVAQNTSLINTGTQNYIPYYSTSGSGTTLSASAFFSVDESVRAVKLENQGRLRFQEAILNGSQYIEFRAPSALAANTAYILPAADGAAGAALTTDGGGNLSFTVINNGVVNAGLANQITYYAANGNAVSGLVTVANRVMTSPSGVLGWSLLTAPYLSGVGGALSNGLANQVLTANGAGSFAWATATDLTGEVLSGIANYLAFYPSTGTKVDDTSFLSINNTNREINLENGAALKIYQIATNGSNYVQLKAPALMLGSPAFTLPSADGTSGQALLTDSSGVLSFGTVGRGIVNSGTSKTFAYYPTNTAEVASFPNTAERVAITTGSNTITWGLIGAKYLTASGGLPLDEGALANVLTSNGDGSFLWADVITITGKVNAGTIYRLPYYSASTTVDSSLFIETNESNRALNLLDGSLRLYNASNFIGLTSPTLVSSYTYTLPSADAMAAGEILTSDGSGNLSWVSQVEPGVAQATLAYYADAYRQVAPVANMEITGSPTDLIMSGLSGVAPVAVTFMAGTGSGADGADFATYAGGSDLVTGTWRAGVGSSDILTLTVASMAVLGVPLVLTNASTGKSIGFTAGSPAADLIWTLPSTDGVAGQVLSTDSFGNLDWSTAGGTISSGTVGALAVYTAPNTVGESILIAPAAVPSVGETSIIVDTAGSMTYQMLVTPSGSAGNVALYTAGQTVGYNQNINYNGTALELGNNGAITLTTASSLSVSLAVATLLSSSYTLTLPTNAPSSGDILVSDASGNLSFQTMEADALHQKGYIVVEQNVEEATVLFPLPFDTDPTVVTAQWAMTGTNLPAFLPTIAIDQASFEGFVIQFSTMTPTSGSQYKIYWEAYRNGSFINTPNVFFAGGEIGTGLTDAVKFFSMDNDTGAVGSALLTAPRGYAAGTSSVTTGRILGGVEGVASVDKISSLTYATGTLADLSAVLPAPKSSAAGVGTKENGYVAGGETLASGAMSSIDKIVHSTDTVSTLVATLTADAVRRGAAHSRTAGYIVNVNPTSTVEILDFAGETVSAGPSNFGTSAIQVGCNNNIGGVGYFAKNTGTLYSYYFGTNTITALGSALTSGSGVGGAGNSMRKGYFVNGSGLEALLFRTETVTVVNTLTDTYVGASTTAVQSGGLL